MVSDVYYNKNDTSFIGMEILDEQKNPINHAPSKGQMMVAERMKELIGNTKLFGEKFFPEFVLSLGDNFYDSGISLKDADERFLKTFYKAYGGIGLQWITLAGNNDYKVPKNEQINITENKNGKGKKHKGHHKNVHISEEEKKRIEKQEKDENFEKARERVLAQMIHSEMKFPSEYYVHSHNLEGFNVVFIMIDTFLLCGGSRKDSLSLQKEEGLSQEKKTAKKLAQEKHFAWLEKTLPKYSRADYLFVAGHYPLYMSEGDRSYTCANRLRNLFKKNNISAYLAGHEHSLKYIQIPESETFTFNQIVSGAATKMENCLQEKHVLSNYKDDYEDKIINMTPYFRICHPAGLNETQFKENQKILKKEWTEKRILEEEIKEIEQIKEDQVVPEDLVNEYWRKKAELKELEKQLDADTFVNGGFVAVKIDINFARFSFETVGENELKSRVGRKIVTGKQNHLGVFSLVFYDKIYLR
uniref:Calcineurin-like phosphoesterase domain-containing protein n=1 Tax=Meloidogyne floridensis TaxID=298350 RepID=A0A915NPM5_9BILA